MLNLITDRTQGDVDRAAYLKSRSWQDMTAEEQAEWAAELKGAYNAGDLNRVEEAVRYLSDQLRDMGYPIDLYVFGEWTKDRNPNTQDLIRYFDNVAQIRALLPVYDTTPEAPSADLAAFNYEKANDLEKILADVEEIMRKLASSWFYLGDLYAGEV